MRARYVSNVPPESLLDPAAPAWKKAGAERVGLEGTPLGMQPTALIRAAWKDRKIGAVDQVKVSALHDGSVLAFRLEWRDPSESRGGDNTDFPDGAAVMLPSAPDAPIFTMGAPGMAVNAWYWRADDEGRLRHVVAEGIGTSRTVGLEPERARGLWKEGRWSVVIARALRIAGDEPVAQLEAGQKTGFAVAIWDGGSGERAGIKSFSGALWQELQLDAMPTARR